MQKMTVAAGRLILSDVEKLLQDYCTKNGLRLELKGGFSYDDKMIKLKGCSFYVQGTADKPVLTEDETMYDLNQKMYQLPKRGTVFISQSSGEQFKIKGWKSRSHKYPIAATRLKDGASYKFTVAQVISSVLVP